MSRIRLPDISNLAHHEGVESTPLEDALNRWNPALRVTAAAASDETVIDVLGVIGKDPYTGEGIGAADIALALKGAKDVTVNINSPGGSLWEGAAIYNLLKAHPGKVTTKAIGLAASAASVIMEAGDVRLMGPLSFMMIHNGQVFAAGDRHDLAEVVDTLTTIDSAIRDVYVARTGKHAQSISTMMDETTWMNAKQAIDNNFADELMPEAQIVEESSAGVQNDSRRMKAREIANAAFTAQGFSRTMRRELIASLRNDGGRQPLTDNSEELAAIRNGLLDLNATARKGLGDGTPRAADKGMPRAALDELHAKLNAL
jgi:ATP-dependent Clp protease, protease subunit